MVKVAYIVSRFPHLPETFILREMNALQSRGYAIELFPLVAQKQTVIHPEARPWLDKMHCYNPFSGAALRTNFELLFKKPGRYLSTFFLMIAYNLPSPKFLARSLYVFPCAVQMAVEMQSLGITHIHAHYATHPALAAWIIYRLTDIPYSLTVHAHDIYVDRTMLAPKLRNALFIRSISEFNKRFLIDRYGEQLADKTFVVHCGIDPDRYRIKKEKHPDFRIISVGSLQEYKGHKYLIEACRLLKEDDFSFQCTIVGGGDLYNGLFDQIVELDLTEQVHLIGPKTEGEVAELLSAADCFILPSIIAHSGKMEGIPVVLMEALASHLPVIATNISGIPELIEDQKSGLLCPAKDAAAIAQKILWVHDHPRESAALAETGYRKVIDEFSLDNSVEALIRLFSKFDQKRMAGER